MAPSRRNVLFGIMTLPAGGLLAGRPRAGLTATVYNGFELQTALQAAGSGSAITLAPGDYGDVGPFTLRASEVSVRVQAPLRTVLRSRLVVEGSFVDLEGLALEDGVVLAGTGLTLSQTVLRGGAAKITGVNTSVSGNSFSGLGGYAVVIEGSARGPRVTNNSIRNCHGAVAVGDSMRTSTTRLGALVQGNRIESCTGDSETIMVKCSGNTISGNTLRSCNNISNRHGEDNTYSGNVLERCYSIVIQDRGNKVINNRAVSPRLRRSFRVMGGNITADSNDQGGHPQAVNTYVAGNSGGGLEIGSNRNSGQRLPAVNTTVASHSGTIRVLNAVGTKLPGGGGGKVA